MIKNNYINITFNVIQCSKEQDLIADWRAGREQLVIDYKRKCQDVCYKTIQKISLFPSSFFSIFFSNIPLSFLLFLLKCHCVCSSVEYYI